MIGKGEIFSLILLALVMGLAATSATLALYLNVAEEELGYTQEQLKITEGELNSTKQILDNTEKILEGTKRELGSTESALGTTKGQLERTEGELEIEESKVKVEDLREFGSLLALERWLANNKVSENEYIEDIYDCDDFAIDLVRDAREDGYELFVMGGWYGYEYADVRDFDVLIAAKDIGYYIDVEGVHEIESGNYYWEIDADKLLEVFTPDALFDISDIDELILYNEQDFAGHAFCIARIKGIWYSIEPRDDEVEILGGEL